MEKSNNLSVPTRKKTVPDSFRLYKGQRIEVERLLEIINKKRREDPLTISDVVRHVLDQWITTTTDEINQKS